MTTSGDLDHSTVRPSARRAGRFEHVVSVPPGPSRIAIEPIAWKETIAAIGAWSPAVAYRPVLEQRLWRSGPRGALQHTLTVVLHDPFEQLDDRTASAEIAELLRPINERRPLRPLPARVLARYRAPVIQHLAELADADPFLPEGGDALEGLFSRLVSGLRAMPGQVGLSMLVAPARDLRPDAGLTPPLRYPDVVDDRSDTDRQDRQVEFRLRIFAEHPILATLLARAEALCLSRRPVLSSWQVPLDGQQLAAARIAVAVTGIEAWADPAPIRTVNPRIAAITLSLVETPEGAHRAVDGRPVTGPLPVTGAVLGRVARPDGRRVPWRLTWEQRRLHVLLAGSSGCGKTTTIKRLVLDDVAAERSVVLVDPHGDVAGEIADLVPAHRLVHVDPRLDQSAALDLLAPDPAKAAANLMSAVCEVWPADWAGPSWNRAISLTLRGLAASTRFSGAATLADVERFVTDHAWRDELIASVPDLALRRDLTHEHEVWRSDTRGSGGGPSWVQYVSAKFAPLTQGPGRTLFNTPPRHSLEAQLAVGSVIVVALPLGVLGAETTRLAGRMFLSRLTTAVAAQGAHPEECRRPTAIYCDEAHLLVGGALAGLFAQARKFATAVHVAVQAPSMLGCHLDEILTNTQTHLLGRLNNAQAGYLVDRAGQQTARCLAILPRHHLAVIAEDHDPVSSPVVLSPVPPPMAVPPPLVRRIGPTVRAGGSA